MGSKTQTLCIVAGGSGGHLLPVITYAQHWLQKHSDGRIVLFTNNNNLERTIVHESLFINEIVFLKIGNRGKTSKLRLVFQLFVAYFRTFRILKKINPARIVSSGGLISLPVCMAGRKQKRFIELLELNAEPGLAIKFLATLSSQISIVFEESKQHFKFLWYDLRNKCKNICYPLRYTNKQPVQHNEVLIQQVNNLIKINEARRFFSSHRITLFLLGGSQGSLFLNNLLKKFLIANPEWVDHLQIIHQTGSKDTTDWHSFYEIIRLPAYAFTFRKQIQHLYQLTNLVIARAGAGTLFELAHFNKKSIIIPLVAKTTRHQVNNAQEMAQVHPELFTVIKQSTIEHHYEIFEKTLHVLLETILEKKKAKQDKPSIVQPQA